MISTEQYFAKPHSAEQAASAADLLERVNRLLAEAVAAGVYSWPIDPDTGTGISGSRGGDGDGGFRLSHSTTGAAGSAHKEARAVDAYDPGDRLDRWLDTFEDGHGGNTKLAQYGLYREAPDATPGWSHLSTRAPRSGRRTYIP